MRRSYLLILILVAFTAASGQEKTPKSGRRLQRARSHPLPQE